MTRSVATGPRPMQPMSLITGCHRCADTFRTSVTARVQWLALPTIASGANPLLRLITAFVRLIDDGGNICCFSLVLGLVIWECYVSCSELIDDVSFSLKSITRFILSSVNPQRCSMIELSERSSRFQRAVHCDRVSVWLDLVKARGENLLRWQRQYRQVKKRPLRRGELGPRPHGRCGRWPAACGNFPLRLWR